MQKVNGEWIKASYMLPKGSTFYIRESRGSYTLRYKAPELKWYHPHTGGVIRTAIIDYKYCR